MLKASTIRNWVKELARFLSDFDIMLISDRFPLTYLNSVNFFRPKSGQDCRDRFREAQENMLPELIFGLGVGQLEALGVHGAALYHVPSLFVPPESHLAYLLLLTVVSEGLLP